MSSGIKFRFRAKLILVLLLVTVIPCLGQGAYDDYGESDYEDEDYARYAEEEYGRHMEKYYKRSYTEIELYNRYGRGTDGENGQLLKWWNLSGLGETEVTRQNKEKLSRETSPDDLFNPEKPVEEEEEFDPGDPDDEKTPPPPTEPGVPVNTAISFLLIAGIGLGWCTLKRRQ